MGLPKLLPAIEEAIGELVPAKLGPRRWQNKDPGAAEEPGYWEDFFEDVVATARLRLDLAEPDKLSDLVSSIDSGLLGEIASLEITNSKQAAVAVRKFDALGPASGAPELEAMAKRNASVVRRLLAAIRRARRELQELRVTHPKVAADWPVQPFKGDGVKLNPRLMHPERPYTFDVGGHPMVAVKMQDGSVEVYDLPQPEVTDRA